jgi:hypothetical protein
MPKFAKLSRVPADKLAGKKDVARVIKHKASFPKTAKASSKMKSDFKKWKDSIKAPKAPATKTMKIKAVRLTSKQLTSLRQIHESPTATAEIVSQKMNPDNVLGVMYSSLATYEYYKLQAEYKKRQKSAKTSASKDALKRQWAEIVQSAQKGFAAAGLSNLSEKDLNNFAGELKKSKNNFNAVVNIANSATSDKSTAPVRVASVSGAFVPVTGAAVDPVATTVPSPNDICDHPLEGSFTREISKSFNMSVRLYVWCPTWAKPWRWCWKTFVLAGVSFSVGLDVGYRVTCCGATAWGNAYAEACGTVVGIKVCASCSASVNGVAGIGRTPSTGDSCIYGLGLTAQLTCTLAGITVFAFAYSFGYNITAPCPPPQLPC